MSVIRGVVGDPGIKWNFPNLDKYLDQIISKGLKNNISILIFHGAIRTSVMEFENRIATKEEVNLIQHSLQMVRSDSIPAGNPHPRLYGNYPLFIGKFVRDKKVLSL